MANELAELAAVRRAAAARRRADASYVAALIAASKVDGLTLEQIGDAAGISKQGVSNLLQRHAGKEVMS